jgi:hypothetical protein
MTSGDDVVDVVTYRDLLLDHLDGVLVSGRSLLILINQELAAE